MGELLPNILLARPKGTIKYSEEGLYCQFCSFCFGSSFFVRKKLPLVVLLKSLTLQLRQDCYRQLPFYLY